MFVRVALVAAAIGAAGLGLSPAAFAQPQTQQQPFKNCTAARAAGYEDIPSTSEYYGPWLDRDNDGIGCES
jgi:hypothetical protein